MDRDSGNRNHNQRLWNPRCKHPWSEVRRVAAELRSPEKKAVTELRSFGMPSGRKISKSVKQDGKEEVAQESHQEVTDQGPDLLRLPFLQSRKDSRSKNVIIHFFFPFIFGLFFIRFNSVYA